MTQGRSSAEILTALPVEVEGPALIEANGVARIFPGRGGRAAVKAVADVDLVIAKGETLGLVGESGSGKSTLGRVLAGLDRPTSGTVTFDGGEILTRDGPAFRAQRRQIQFVFQDPMSALNPRLTVERQVAEVLRAHRGMGWQQATEQSRVFLEKVGVNREMAARYVHQMSGGQRQRVVIARSLVLEPDFVVFDEPVSALDLSIQAQILELIAGMRSQLALTSVFITHDLRVVRYVSDRIAVLYLGHLVEIGRADDVYHRPAHPYTQALLAALPHIDPAMRKPKDIVSGDITETDATAQGCLFAPRCPLRHDRCLQEAPDLLRNGSGRHVACHAVEGTP